jgi:hypothetical protein
MMDANVPKKLMYLVDKFGIQEGKFLVGTVINCRGVIYAMSSVGFFSDKISSLGDPKKWAVNPTNEFFFFEQTCTKWLYFKEKEISICQI